MEHILEYPWAAFILLTEKKKLYRPFNGPVTSIGFADVRMVDITCHKRDV